VEISIKQKDLLFHDHLTDQAQDLQSVPLQDLLVDLTDLVQEDQTDLESLEQENQIDLANLELENQTDLGNLVRGNQIDLEDQE
jgi:hypothetical protein